MNIIRQLAWPTALALCLSAGAGHAQGPSSTCGVEGLTATEIAAARQILDQVPLIDGHNDLPWALREQFSRQLGRIDLSQDLRQRDLPLHTDIPRLRQGGVGAQFWSVYVPVELPASEAVQAVIEQIDVVHRLTELYPDTFTLATTASEVEELHRAGKIASLIGIEGGHSIHNSLAVLRQLFILGARYMTITHWQNTDWADSATDEPELDGLSEFGREVIREMNRLGMIVDLSHVSEATMLDALEVATAPVIFSHSSARGVVDHPRNVPDSVLSKVRENGGVVMVTFVPPFISQEVRQHGADRSAEEARLKTLHPGALRAVEEALARWDLDHPKPTATLAQVADHMDYLRARFGAGHIGLGSDFDGISSVPRGLADVSCFPALLAELLRRGYSQQDVELIAGRNLLRVMRQVETAAAASRQEGRSSDALIAELDCIADQPCKHKTSREAKR